MATPPTTTTTLWEDLKKQKADKTIYQQAVTAAFDYLDNVDHREVFPSPAALDALKVFDDNLPEGPSDPFDILKELHDVGSPATVAQGGGRYFGFVNGGVIPVALAARFLADTWDQNTALRVMSPIASKLEHVAERWIVDLLGLPKGTAAGFVTGSSTATLCGVLAGRNTLLKRNGWDVNEQGLFGAPPIRVVMSADVHSSVHKALGIVGIGRAQKEVVPVDDQGRIDVSQMPPLDGLTLLILQAGNVNSGSFDDFTAACKLAREGNAWVHIDGAFGLWAAASDTTRYLTAGIDMADSLSVDMHKTLNAPYDGAVVLCPDRNALVSAFEASASYLQFSAERDGMRYTPEMSRRARGVEVWALLKGIGRGGVDSLIARLCHHAKMFGEELSSHGFRIVNDVVFNQVLVACNTPDLTRQTLTHVQNSGECWCGSSQWFGEPVIRISVCSWVTTEDDVRRSVAAFVKAHELAKEQDSL